MNVAGSMLSLSWWHRGIREARKIVDTAQNRAEYPNLDSIVLVSTHTIDVMRDPLTGRERLMPGGPAFYIGAALERLDAPYVLITGQAVRVDVLPVVDGEQYVIPAFEQIPLPPCFTGPAVILSPVMREIDPLGVPPVEGLLVIDLQGFVREPSLPSGEVETQFDLAPLLNRAGIVKATEQELNRLTPKSRAALEHTVLLVTHGRRGVTIREQGITHVIPSRPIDVLHTVGAGDTLLAAFVYGVLQGQDLPDAGGSAARFTEQTLADRAAAPRG